MIKKILLPAILLAGFLSCKKQESGNNFLANQTYESSTTATVQAVKLYTNNGEITDTAIIRAFVQNNTFTIAHAFIFGTVTEPVPFKMLNIHFNENSTAIVNRYPPGVPASGAVISAHPATYSITAENYILITETDSITNYNYSTACNNLFENGFQIRPIKRCAPAGGSLQICSNVNSFPIKIINGNLVIPLISLLVKSGVPSSYCTMHNMSAYWNFFNSGVLAMLQPTDTLAMQVKELSLLKK